MSNKISGHTHSQEQLNHHANQNNPNSAAYQSCQNNRANQLNPNHQASGPVSSKK